MADENSISIENDRHSFKDKSISKNINAAAAHQFLSTAEAARMLGLSTTLVQTLVDQGDLKGWKTRGGHRRISSDSIFEYQSFSRYSGSSAFKNLPNPKVTVVVESSVYLLQLKSLLITWNLPIDVQFFESVTEALLDLTTKKPDMIVVEMSMPRLQQEKTFQALENFNQKCHSPLSVVLLTSEKNLTVDIPAGASSSIQVVSGPLTSTWLHAYFTGVVASCRK
jgi:excisionase family DNA binding protein